MIAFDQQVFARAQVDAVLLLASSEGESGYRIIRAADASALSGLAWPVSPADDSAQQTLVQPERWSAALDPTAAAIYEYAARDPGFIRLAEWARVDIGFVSGADDYFVPSDEQVRTLGLPASVLVPAVRRPGDARGLVVRPGEVGHLFRPDGPNAASLPSVAAYIKAGESSGVSGRYKCRVRQPWYTVPLQRTPPDAFLPYMNHRGPRLIVNPGRAWSTNLLHGVRLRDLGDDIDVLAAAMTSSATLLSAEIEGRSYGGGVLKLETKEAERLLVANPGAATRVLLKDALPELDSLVREGDIESAALLTDRIFGLDHERLWGAYVVYRTRRLGRRRASSRRDDSAAPGP